MTQVKPPNWPALSPRASDPSLYREVTRAALLGLAVNFVLGAVKLVGLQMQGKNRDILVLFLLAGGLATGAQNNQQKRHR